MNAMPEYDQVKKLAREKGVAFSVVRDAVLAQLDTKEKSSVADA